MAGSYDFRAARFALVQEFGRDALARLHRENALYDWLAIVGTWVLFGGLIYLLGTLPFGWLWVGCVFLQAFVVMAFGYLLHDLFVHRRVGGRWFARWMGTLTGRLASLDRSPYAHFHFEHHEHTGIEVDEAYKDDLDRRWKRALFLTWPGYLLAFRRALRGSRTRYPPGPKGAFQPFLEGPRVAEFAGEKMLRRAYWVALGVAAILWPHFTLLGYVVPLMVGLPPINAVRVILEHGETNQRNPYHCATYYRTGFLTRVLYLWGVGDCHLVHHIFPRIPFYRMGAACDLMRPFFLRHGVRERRWLPGLLYGYFIRNEPHRALWSS